MNSRRDTGKITHTRMAPVTLIKARNIEINAMIVAG
jgi:hypothetical protein